MKSILNSAKKSNFPYLEILRQILSPGQIFFRAIVFLCIKKKNIHLMKKSGGSNL